METREEFSSLGSEEFAPKEGDKLVPLLSVDLALVSGGIHNCGLIQIDK